MNIKICGITTVETANVAIDSGATMIGFVFAPSRREISISLAKEIIETLPTSIEKVGVFVNESVHRIHFIAKEVGLTMIQLHGEEANSDMQKIRYPTIRAISVDQLNTINQSQFQPAIYLIDSPPGEFKGGTGVAFDWRTLQNLQSLPPFILAGGLTPKNVYHAIIQTKCSGVDVSSGVETDGSKDHEKIRVFIDEVNRTEGEIL